MSPLPTVSGTIDIGAALRPPPAGCGALPCRAPPDDAGHNQQRQQRDDDKAPARTRLGSRPDFDRRSLLEISFLEIFIG